MDDLVKRLREDQPVTQDMVSTMQCELQNEAADRIEELEAKLREAALSELSALGQASEAYTAQLDAEAKLAKVVEGMQDLSEDFDKPSAGLTDFGERQHYLHLACRLRDKARTTLAAMEGQNDE